ncbi:MAG: thiol reductant ABC exporter subunit CydC, partial [Acetobacter persici]
MNISDQKEASTPALTDCQAVLRILGLWRRQAPRLIIGVMLALIALCLGLVLMQASGLRLASSVLGEVVITTALLRWVGGGRVVLRYAERLFAHDAMFRALADLRVWFFHSLAQG